MLSVDVKNLMQKDTIKCLKEAIMKIAEEVEEIQNQLKNLEMSE